MEKKEHPKAHNLHNYLDRIAHIPPISDKQKALKTLYARYVKCTECPLSNQGRSQVVFGSGNPCADIMFVGEGPGKDEDLKGLPFVGKAGRLLTKIIEAMGLIRDNVFISNVVKCRPPENRTPLTLEMDTCSSILLFKEIKIIQPKVICTLGACATGALLGKDVRLGLVRGVFHQAHSITILPTYHPAYLLRNPSAKSIVWGDMQRIMHYLAEKTPKDELTS